MHMLRNITAVILLSVTLSGCETVPLKQAARDTIQSVAIVSIVGDEIAIVNRFSLRYFFSTPSRKSLDPGWKTNYLVERVAGLTTKEFTSLEVKKVRYDVDDLKGMFHGTLFSSDVSTSEHKAQLRELVQQAGVDALILVSHCNCADFVGGNDDDRLTGVGLYRKHWTDDLTQLATFAVLRYTLIDAGTLDVIATTVTSDYLNHGRADLWTETPAQLSDKQRSTVLNLLAAHIHNTAAQALRYWQLPKPSEAMPGSRE